MAATWASTGHAQWVAAHWDQIRAEHDSLRGASRAISDALTDPIRDPGSCEQYLRRQIDKYNSSGGQEGLAPWDEKPAKSFDADAPEPEVSGDVEVETFGDNSGGGDVRFRPLQNGTTLVESGPTPDIKSVRQLLEVAGMDPDDYIEAKPAKMQVHQMGAKVTDWNAAIGTLERVKSGDLTIKAALAALKNTTRVEKVNLWNVAGWIQRRATEEMLTDLQKAILADVRQEGAKLHERAPESEASQVLAFPAVSDVHLGNRADGWDLESASRCYQWTMKTLIDRMAVQRPERILVWVGQDLIHAETEDGKTTKGTLVGLGDEWLRVYKAAMRLQRWTIDYALTVAPVTAVEVAGNHARLAEITLALWLEEFYGEHPDVEFVPGTGDPRSYMEWGDVMLALCHGHMEAGSLHEIVSSEASQMWGRTIWREAIQGHLHHKHGKRSPRKPDIEELQGLIVRRLSALTPADQYHQGKGYVGSHRGGDGYTYHKERGLQDTAHANIVPAVADEIADFEAA